MQQIILCRWCRLSIPEQERYNSKISIDQKNFIIFGLIVYCRKGNNKSKTEAMHFPRPDTTTSKKDTSSIIIDEENKEFKFTNKFKYLWIYFQPDLKDDFDIKKGIRSAIGAFKIMEKVQTDAKMNIDAQLWIMNDNQYSTIMKNNDIL